MKEATYKITVREREYRAKGETAQDAIERLCNRRLPDGDTWWMFEGVKMYDAYTRGQQWAQCRIRLGDDSEAIAFADRI